MILLILFIVAVVSAVNSSIVIDKIAKRFAPDYNLSYEHISGNVFTGIKIDKLKYDNKIIANNIIYKWDPISLLQKKISIDKIKIENADIDVIKSLVASFTVDGSDNNSSEPFSFDVGVDNISISLNPFKEEGITFYKTMLTANDMTYFKNGKVAVKEMLLDIDSNLTKFSFKGSMKENKLNIHALSIKSLNSQMLESIIAKFTHAKRTKEINNGNDVSDTSLNPLIPRIITLKHFEGSLQPRVYKSMQIKQFNVTLDDLRVDTEKIVANEKNSLNIGNFALRTDSNVTDIRLQMTLTEDKVIFKYLGLKNIDILALQHLIVSDSNESNMTTTQDESNALIPKTVVIKQLHADFLPAEYEPVKLKKLIVNAKEIHFDVEKLLLNNAVLDLNGTTNLSNVSFGGKVQNNHLSGKVHLVPNKHLFELYELPVRKEAIGDIVVDLNASKERIVADVKAKAKHILKNKKGEFNVDIDNLNSHVVYDLLKHRLKADSQATVTTPYAKNIVLSNDFLMDDTISYKGEVKVKKLSGIDIKLTKPLQHLLIRYSGNTKSLKTILSSDQLKGHFDSSDLKKGQLHLETTTPLMLNEMLDLPPKLKDTKVNAVVDAPVDFENITPLKAQIKISSNIANMDADLLYDKTMILKAKTVIPKDSLLRSFNKEVKWDALAPFDTRIEMAEKSVSLQLSSKQLNADIQYFLNNGRIDGKVKLAGLVTNISGIVKKSLKIDTKISSMKSLNKSISSLYTFEAFPPIEGSAAISAVITDLKRIKFLLSSPEIVYKPGRKAKYVIKNIKLSGTLDQSSIILNSYTLTYNKEKFFSNKASQIQIDGDRIRINPLWLNDALHIAGDYNLKTKQGSITTQSKKLPIHHEYADIDTKIDIKTLLDGNNTTINGKITLLGGNIKYDLSQKSFASDSDIVIIQEMKKKKASPFMDNLSTNIQIETKEPLVYKQGPIHIKAKAGLSINKVQHGPLLVVGSVELLKGDSYIFQNKKFVLEKSFVYFTGDPNKPQLDIKVKYKSIKHLITIAISGTPEAPNINFSSTPSLTKEKILSVILFDSEEGGDTHSGDEMMKMMGGAMAKSALSDMGIKLDHLVLGADGSVEVGKKPTNKITIIYINGTIPEAKLIYQHGKHTESTISASQKSQSYDIIYKNDF